jgi:hypothetical protein
VSPLRTEKQKMLAGELYHANDPELEADRNAVMGEPSAHGLDVSDPAYLRMTPAPPFA